jgi:hypothetical protein
MKKASPHAQGIEDDGRPGFLVRRQRLNVARQQLSMSVYVAFRD